jgi:hypothetical protein
MTFLYHLRGDFVSHKTVSLLLKLSRRYPPLMAASIRIVLPS